MAQHVFIQDGVTVTVDLSAEAEAVLADQVVSNASWLNGFAQMVFNKIGAVSGRIAKAELDAAMAAGTVNQLPATQNEIVAAKFARPGYKNRAQRDAEGSP